MATTLEFRSFPGTTEVTLTPQTGATGTVSNPYAATQHIGEFFRVDVSGLAGKFHLESDTGANGYVWLTDSDEIIDGQQVDQTAVLAAISALGNVQTTTQPRKIR